MYNISANTINKDRLARQEEWAYSIRSPFLTIVSGFATLPLIVVTPDSRAYRCNQCDF